MYIIWTCKILHNTIQLQLEYEKVIIIIQWAVQSEKYRLGWQCLGTVKFTLSTAGNNAVLKGITLCSPIEFTCVSEEHTCLQSSRS